MATAPRRIPDPEVTSPLPDPQAPDPMTAEGAAPIPELDVRAEDTPTQDVRPTEEDIRLEAYLLHAARGHQHGNDLEDWLEAERRLRQGSRLTTGS
jgi:hypothetical protein